MIIQLSGELALLLEINGATIERRLRKGEFLIVPRAVWHTANVISAGQALFITPGTGTEGRPRVGPRADVLLPTHFSPCGAAIADAESGRSASAPVLALPGDEGERCKLPVGYCPTFVARSLSDPT